METDFYFADIQVGIALKVDEKGALAGLTDNELASLRQMIYTTLNCFIYTRALFLTDNVIPKKYIECAKHNCDCTCHRG